MAAPPSLWSHKPWWCQPWSIVLTGVAVVGGSLWWPGRLWLSAPLALAVLAWWWLFLAVVPAAYRAEMAETAVQAAEQGAGPLNAGVREPSR